MIQPVDTILALVLLSVLISFGSSRLPMLIKVLAFQGVVVSIVPLFIGHDLTAGGIVFTLVTLIERSGRELPIQPDVIGLSPPLADGDHIKLEAHLFSRFTDGCGQRIPVAGLHPSTRPCACNARASA